MGAVVAVQSPSAPGVEADAGADRLREILDRESERPLDGLDIITPRSQADGSAVAEVIRLRALLDAHLDRTEQVLRRSAAPTPVAARSILSPRAGKSPRAQKTTPHRQQKTTPRSVFRQLSTRLGLVVETRMGDSPAFTPVVLPETPLAAPPTQVTPKGAPSPVAEQPTPTPALEPAPPAAKDAEALPKVQKKFNGHLQMVTCAAFTPGGAFVVSGSADKSLRLFKVASGWCMRVMRGHSDAVTCCAVLRRRAALSPTAAADAGAEKRGKGRSSGADVRASPPRKSAAPGGLAMVSTRPVAETELMVSGGCDNVVNVWNWRRGTNVCSLAGHRDTVTSVDIALVPRDWTSRNSPSKRSRRRTAGAISRSLFTVTFCANSADDLTCPPHIF